MESTEHKSWGQFHCVSVQHGCLHGDILYGLWNKAGFCHCHAIFDVDCGGMFNFSFEYKEVSNVY